VKRGKESLIITTKPDKRRNRRDPLPAQPAIAVPQLVYGWNRSRLLGNLCKYDQIATVFGNQVIPNRFVQPWILIADDEVIARCVRIVNCVKSRCLEPVNASLGAHHRSSRNQFTSRAYRHHMQFIPSTE